MTTVHAGALASQKQGEISRLAAPGGLYVRFGLDYPDRGVQNSDGNERQLPIVSKWHLDSGLNALPATPMFASAHKLASVSVAVMSQASFTVRTQAGAVCFDVVVVPRASRSKIVGLHANALKVSLAAPPVDGEANQALCDLLAKLLGVPKRAVEIQRGERSKHKSVLVSGVTVDQVMSLLTPDSDP